MGIALDQHTEQQIYISDLAAKGTNQGGILAMLALRWGGKAAREAMRIWQDRDINAGRLECVCGCGCETPIMRPTCVCPDCGEVTRTELPATDEVYAALYGCLTATFDADDSGVQQHAAPASSRGFFDRAQPIATAVVMLFVLGSVVPVLVWCLCEGRLS